MVAFTEKWPKNGFMILSYFCEKLNDFRSIQFLRNSTAMIMVVINIY